MSPSAFLPSFGWAIFQHFSLQTLCCAAFYWPTFASMVHCMRLVLFSSNAHTHSDSLGAAIGFLSAESDLHCLVIASNGLEIRKLFNETIGPKFISYWNYVLLPVLAHIYFNGLPDVCVCVCVRLLGICSTSRELFIISISLLILAAQKTRKYPPDPPSIRTENYCYYPLVREKGNKSVRKSHSLTHTNTHTFQ